MSPPAVAWVAGLEIATVAWFVLDAIARSLLGTRGRSFAPVRTAAVDVVFDPLLELYSCFTWLAGMLLSNWTLLVALLLLGGSGVLVSDHGPLLIEGLDSAWEHSYWVWVAPVKELLNVGRLVVDALLGVYNLVLFLINDPLTAVLKTVVQCTGPVASRPFYANFVDMGGAISGAAVGTFNVLTASNPLTADFATQGISVPLRRIAGDLAGRMECACGVDHGLLYVPVRAAMVTTPGGSFADDVFYHGFNALLDLARAPLNAVETFSKTAIRKPSSTDAWEGSVTEVMKFDGLFDHLGALFEAAGQLFDVVASAFVNRLQKVLHQIGDPAVGWQWPSAGGAAGAFGQALVEFFRLLANYVGNAVAVIKGEIKGDHLLYAHVAPSLDGSRFFGSLDFALNATVDATTGLWAALGPTACSVPAG